MSFIAILMFSTLGLALGVGAYQLSKVNKKLPDDESDITPGTTLKQMDQDVANRRQM